MSSCISKKLCPTLASYNFDIHELIFVIFGKQYVQILNLLGGVIPSLIQGAANILKAVIWSTIWIWTLKQMCTTRTLCSLCFVISIIVKLHFGLCYWLPPCINLQCSEILNKPATGRQFSSSDAMVPSDYLPIIISHSQLHYGRHADGNRKLFLLPYPSGTENWGGIVPPGRLYTGCRCYFPGFVHSLQMLWIIAVIISSASQLVTVYLRDIGVTDSSIVLMHQTSLVVVREILWLEKFVVRFRLIQLDVTNICSLILCFQKLLLSNLSCSHDFPLSCLGCDCNLYIYLWSPYVIGQTIYIFILSFVLSSFFLA